MTQADIDLILCHNLTKYIRIDLLDSIYNKIGELQGAATISPSISAGSDIRRTCTLTISVPEKEYMTSAFSNIGPKSLIRPYIGLYNGNSTAWYILGTLLITENGYTYDAVTQQLSLSLVDMMAAMTSARGSQVGGSGLMIPYESNARDAIIATVAQFSPFHQYDVAELPDVIPYDLEFESTVYPFDILKTILDLWPQYQMYYTPQGVFTVSLIPTGIGDPVVLDETVMDKLLAASNTEQRSNSYSDVRNTTEIFGASLDAGYTASECVSNVDTYVLTISNEFETMEQNSTYSFTTDAASVSGQKIKIQDFDPYQIYVRYSGGTEELIPAGYMELGVPYVVSYLDGKFYFQGESEIHVIVQEVTEMPSPEEIAAYKEYNNCRVVEYVVNPTSRFAADVIGEVKQVLKDGDYADIFTTQLAIERGKYENYTKCRLTDKVILHSKFIPFLDANQKISYTSPSTSEVMTVLVQDITPDISNFTMDISATQFFPDLPWDDVLRDFGLISDESGTSIDYGLITEISSTSRNYQSVA
jgi:hypothetical protein